MSFELRSAWIELITAESIPSDFKPNVLMIFVEMHMLGARSDTARHAKATALHAKATALHAKDMALHANDLRGVQRRAGPKGSLWRNGKRQTSH